MVNKCCNMACIRSPSYMTPEQSSSARGGAKAVSNIAVQEKFKWTTVGDAVDTYSCYPEVSPLIERGSTFKMSLIVLDRDTMPTRNEKILQPTS